MLRSVKSAVLANYVANLRFISRTKNIKVNQQVI